MIFTLAVLLPFDCVFGDEITPQKVIDLVNRDRLAHNQHLLVKSEALTRVAQMKLEDMFAKNYFEHTSPEGKTPWVWYDTAGYDYSYAGENLAIHFTDAQSQQRAWMESPTHRKNLLSPNYHEIGVAVGRGKIDGRETTVAVQEFGSQRGVAYANVLPESTAPEPQPAISAEMIAPAQMNTTGTHEYVKLYEKIFLLLVGIMIFQIGIMGYGIFFSKRVLRKDRISTLAIHADFEREYPIPVRIVRV